MIVREKLVSKFAKLLSAILLGSLIAVGCSTNKSEPQTTSTADDTQQPADTSLVSEPDSSKQNLHPNGAYNFGYSHGYHEGYHTVSFDDDSGAEFINFLGDNWNMARELIPIMNIPIPFFDHQAEVDSGYQDCLNNVPATSMRYEVPNDDDNLRSFKWRDAYRLGYAMCLQGAATDHYQKIESGFYDGFTAGFNDQHLDEYQRKYSSYGRSYTTLAAPSNKFAYLHGYSFGYDAGYGDAQRQNGYNQNNAANYMSYLAGVGGKGYGHSPMLARLSVEEEALIEDGYQKCERGAPAYDTSILGFTLCLQAASIDYYDQMRLGHHNGYADGYQDGILDIYNLYGSSYGGNYGTSSQPSTVEPSNFPDLAPTPHIMLNNRFTPLSDISPYND